MKKRTLCGIYCIRKDDQFYVGQSINILKRFNSHRVELLTNKHCNSKLQNAINKYGIDSFHFEIIELSEPDFLADRESYWIDTLDSVCYGYNICPGSKSTAGRKFSDEVRANMSNAQKKRLAENPAALEELLLRMREVSISRTGYKHTEEAKNKIREKKATRPPHSEEVLQKIANTLRQNYIKNGPKKRSEEARKRMSDAQRRVAEQNRAKKELLPEEEIAALADRKKFLRDKNNKNRNEKRKAQRAEARRQRELQHQSS